MSSEEKLLTDILKIQKKEILQCILDLNNRTYPLKEVIITKSPTPVTKPTTRGGVYFSDTSVYKIQGAVYDTSIIPLLSKTMLGPNTEFGEIEVTANIIIKKIKRNVSFFTYLTNTVQSSSKVVLNMNIVRMVLR